MTPARTRFAPSPTGLLHMGHVVSALHARQMAGEGTCLLRIEDIDLTRCRAEHVEAMIADLAWLGLLPAGDIRRQSAHLPEYRATLSSLRERGLLYPCTCSRQEIAAHATATAPDGSVVYPGLCREGSRAASDEAPVSWRLDMAQALRVIGGEPGWHETDRSGGLSRVESRAAAFGDVVLGRKDSGVSYHLCVTHDDAGQEIDIVTRGRDLFEATSVHRVLQELLGFRAPLYAHHPLVMGADCRKLSKSAGAPSIRAARSAGRAAEDLLREAAEFLRERGPGDGPGGAVGPPILTGRSADR